MIDMETETAYSHGYGDGKRDAWREIAKRIRDLDALDGPRSMDDYHEAIFAILDGSDE